MKAQASVEFIVIYAALFTIFFIVSLVYLNAGVNLFQSEQSINTMRNAESVAAALNYVYLAGNGATYNFSLTNVISGENITISNFSVQSQEPHANSEVAIVTGDVNASWINKSYDLISNNNGEININ